MRMATKFFIDLWLLWFALSVNCRELIGPNSVLIYDAMWGKTVTASVECDAAFGFEVCDYVVSCIG